MKKLTRNGIAYDLTISPYCQSIKYDNGDKVTFIFSSEKYRIKFDDQLNENREKIHHSLSNRFGFNIKNDLLSDLKLYTTIEKRGFLIFYNGVAVEWQNIITLDGNKMIMSN